MWKITVEKMVYGFLLYALKLPSVELMVELNSITAFPVDY